MGSKEVGACCEGPQVAERRGVRAVACHPERREGAETQAFSTACSLSRTPPGARDCSEGARSPAQGTRPDLVDRVSQGEIVSCPKATGSCFIGRSWIPRGWPSTPRSRDRQSWRAEATFSHEGCRGPPSKARRISDRW